MREFRFYYLYLTGVRGYLSIKVLEQLIKDTYYSENGTDIADENVFYDAQKKFMDRFDYVAGTSTGGLIAFCVATNYPLLKLKKIYEDPQQFFEKPLWKKIPGTGFFWNLLSAKYSGKKIHDEIDRIINALFEKHDKKLTAKNATLGDLNNLLNPTSPNTKVLLINAYNVTKSEITVFNTNYSGHQKYFLADVLKATMAAPTFFPPQRVRERQNDNETTDGKGNEDGDLFIDGGVFANDPELTALWAVRMDCKNAINYRLMCIGTGCFYPEIPKDTWGGLYGWLLKKGNSGLVIQTLMDATRSLTEVTLGDLAMFSNIRRIKFNYKLTQSMELDDLDFPNKLNGEWANLIDKPEYQALCYFYQRFISGNE